MVLGLGPIGDMASRIALHRGHRVIGVDLVAERLERVRERGAEVLDLNEHQDDLADVIREMTDGRGPDSVIDAVAWRPTAPPVGKRAHTIAGFLPDPLAAKVMRWVDDIMPLLSNGDVLGVEQFHTHKLALHAAPEAYETFQKKRNGAVKILLKP